MEVYYIILIIIVLIEFGIFIYKIFYSEEKQISRIERCVCESNIHLDNCLSYNKSHNLRGSVANIKLKLQNKYPESYKLIQQCSSNNIKK